VKSVDRLLGLRYSGSMSLPAGTRLDDYELVEHLADGAGAEIHRAVRHPFGEVVAVKVPFDEVLTDLRRVRQWRREERLTLDLHHERLVRRVDLDRFKSRPYMAFEYVGGGSVRHWLGCAEGLPISQVVGWGRDLAEALGYLHERGLVHADVKPDNLLVTDDLDVKLADFGATVKMGRFPLTPPRQILEIAEGTPEYMSPEQIQGRELGAQSDVYAWGIVMYELLTGACPFDGDTPIAVMESQLKDHPASIRSRRPEVPAGLEAVVLTAMRRQPEQRHPDMASVIADLDHFDALDPGSRILDPEPPLELQPIGGSSALWRFVGAVAVCYLLVVASILGLVAVTR
jgi:eukaryotic-like serine/threonine-protein kinase